MNLKLSFDVIGGGEDSRWPVAFGSNVNSCKLLSHENQQLKHMLKVTQSSRFHQEVYQHLCLDEAQVFFTSNTDLSATCNALLRENKQHRDHIQIAESALLMKGPEAQTMAYLQQEVDKACRVARGRILEDLQTSEYIDRVHLHNHTLLQKVNFLSDSICQLNQSLHTLQQQQTLQQVGMFTLLLSTFKTYIPLLSGMAVLACSSMALLACKRNHACYIAECEAFFVCRRAMTLVTWQQDLANLPMILSSMGPRPWLRQRPSRHVRLEQVLVVVAKMTL